MRTIHFDNTLRIKQLAATCEIPPTPPGTETFQFEVGETVEHTGTGTYKAGYRQIIASRYQHHGFCYYTMQGSESVHRQKDLQRAIPDERRAS